MSKITSINQIGGIIAEEVTVTSDWQVTSATTTIPCVNCNHKDRVERYAGNYRPVSITDVPVKYVNFGYKIQDKDKHISCNETNWVDVFKNCPLIKKIKEPKGVTKSSQFILPYDMTGMNGQYGKEGEPMKLERTVKDAEPTLIINQEPMTRTQQMINTLRKEGYRIFTKEQWDNFKFLMKNEYDVLGFYIETAVMEVLP